MKKFNLDEVKSFYKGKKVLITGHTGFKGCWLSRWLLSIGANVYGVSDSTEYALYKRTNLPGLVHEYWSDIGKGTDWNYEHCNPTINEIVASVEPDIVFHLAAQPLVRESYDDPVRTYNVNVMGTIRVAIACRDSKVKHAVFITTDKCYDNDESGIPIQETARFGGSDPYSSSKGCCEILIESLRRSFPECAHYFTARAGNVLGGGDFAKDRLLPDIAAATMSPDGEIVLRNPSSIRPWQHVLEPLYGYLLLGMQEDSYGCGVNFGPNPAESYTSLDVLSECNRVLQEVGRKPLTVTVQADRYRPEAKTLLLDNTFAKESLGWVPRLSFEETIGLTLQFYLNMSDDQSLDGLLLNDISTYERKLKQHE